MFLLTYISFCGLHSLKNNIKIKDEIILLAMFVRSDFFQMEIQNTKELQLELCTRLIAKVSLYINIFCHIYNT